MSEVASSVGGCCRAPRGGGVRVTPEKKSARQRDELLASAVHIPGGKVAVGTDRQALPRDGEGISHLVHIKSFRLGNAPHSTTGHTGFRLAPDA